MNSNENSPSPKEIASLLKSEWTERSQSDRAKFYIASHPGWENPEKWTAQAQIDANFVLLGIDDEENKSSDVLEIGCGNGRLVPFIAPKVATYTGFDICGTFISECRQQFDSLPQVRFFETSGSEIPEEALDRKYDFVFAAAVFIHCPLEIIKSYLTSIKNTQNKGTRLRFQVLTDPDDLSEIIPLEVLDPEAHRQSLSCYDGAIEDQNAADETEHVEDSSYQGHQFKMAEIKQLLTSIFGSDSTIHLIRFDPLMVNCEVQIA